MGGLAGVPNRVALALTGKGNHAAAVLAERAIDEFSPIAVLFVGVAGALWPSTALGDVVVATHVYAYHGGTSENDGLKARPRVWEMAHGVDQLARHLARAGDWMPQVPLEAKRPSLHFGPIAAGEIVQDSRLSHEARWIRQHYNDALAIETEAAGVAQAGHLNGSPVLIVRGISDQADGSKTTTDAANWQPRAAANAAAFAAKLAEQLIEERPATPNQHPNTTPSPSTVHNSATGPVGIQAGNVTGSTVWIGGGAETPTTNIAAELAMLRDLLVRARTGGDLDEATYTAARAELDIASQATTSTPQGRSKFLVALKHLRGLVIEVADLAARAAALIAAAKGMS